jgi:HAD superfamily hydrolase (TIGR01509 family)
LIKGLLWDNDGVLVDTERFFFEVNRDLFREHGIELTERQFLDWYLRDNCGAWHLIDGVTPEMIVARRADRDVMYSARLAAESIQPLAGVDAVLAHVGARVPMGVVTSARRDHFNLIHGGLDLLRHFQFVLTSDDYAATKPSPEPYLRGLERLGVNAQDCLVVEDSPRGLQAANAAGIACIVLRHPLTREHSFDGAYRVVDSMAELQAEINALL